MNTALLGLACLAAVEAAELTTSYVHEIRADLALAGRIEVEASPENGGARRSLDDALTIRELARLIPRDAEIRPMDGKIATASYLVLKVYDDAGAKEPTHRLTVTPNLCIFKIDDRLYRFPTEDAKLYAALRDAARDDP